jgi:hypothetical protein
MLDNIYVGPRDGQHPTEVFSRMAPAPVDRDLFVVLLNGAASTQCNFNSMVFTSAGSASGHTLLETAPLDLPVNSIIQVLLLDLGQQSI